VFGFFLVGVRQIRQ
jgi:hypothetical protein